MEINCQEIKDYKIAFKCFKQRFLENKKSIFRLESNEKIYTEDSVQYLIKNFINNAYSGNASFIEKIKSQLIDNPKEKNNSQIVRNAIEVLAHCVYLWRLPPSNARNRIKSVTEILDLDEELKNIKLEKNPFFNNFPGFASVGTYYNVNKPLELAYIIRFLEEYLKNSNPIKILTKKENEIENEITIINTYEYSRKNKDDKEEKPKLSKKQNKEVTTTASIYNALLYLFDSEHYEPIVSKAHKKKIEKAFEDYSKDCSFEEFSPKIDYKIKCIKENLSKKLGKSIESFNFYDSIIKDYWYGELDFEYKNTIIYGAPGTGKTYLTLKTLETKKLLDGNIKYEIVQFHPNYGYEDFIEGIKPVDIENGQIKLKLKNGIFKQMCIDAFQSLKEAKGNLKQAKKYYFIADEVNRAELSRVFGELLVCLEDDKRLRIKEENRALKVEGLKIKLQNSALWEKDHAVVIVDENSNIEEEGEMYFGVPENLYFIGTMNDIDRSIDSFDMALRRRFVWNKYKCDYDVIMEYYSNKETIEIVENYIDACRNLNEYITMNKGLDLGKEFEIGHSYFMIPEKLNESELNKVWKERIFLF